MNKQMDTWKNGWIKGEHLEKITWTDGHVYRKIMNEQV